MKGGTNLPENFERSKKKYRGQMLVDDSEVRERWAEYFRDLLNVEDDTWAVIVAVGDRRVIVMDEKNGKSITKKEVHDALSKRRLLRPQS